MRQSPLRYANTIGLRILILSHPVLSTSPSLLCQSFQHLLTSTSAHNSRSFCSIYALSHYCIYELFSSQSPAFGLILDSGRTFFITILVSHLLRHPLGFLQACDLTRGYLEAFVYDNRSSLCRHSFSCWQNRWYLDEPHGLAWNPTRSLILRLWTVSVSYRVTMRSWQYFHHRIIRTLVIGALPAAVLGSDILKTNGFTACINSPSITVNKLDIQYDRAAAAVTFNVGGASSQVQNVTASLTVTAYGNQVYKKDFDPCEDATKVDQLCPGKLCRVFAHVPYSCWLRGV